MTLVFFNDCDFDEEMEAGVANDAIVCEVEAGQNLVACEIGNKRLA